MLTIFKLLGKWKMYKKMGYKGWVSLIPMFNTFYWYESIMGNGWKMFMPYIPLFGFFVFKYQVCRREYQYWGLKEPNYLYYLFVYGFFESSINPIRFGLFTKYRFKNDVLANQEDDIVTWLLGKDMIIKKDQVNICPSCGQELKENANFCHRCGRNL